MVEYNGSKITSIITCVSSFNNYQQNDILDFLLLPISEVKTLPQTQWNRDYATKQTEVYQKVKNPPFN